MFNAVAGLVIAVLLLIWRHWVPGFLAAGFGASTLGAFILSATVGLFGVQEQQWTGGYQADGRDLRGGVHRRWAVGDAGGVAAPPGRLSHRRRCLNFFAGTSGPPDLGLP